MAARRSRTSIDEPAPGLTTVTSRIGLDRLQARQRPGRVRRPWLPEPILTAPDDADPAPVSRAERLADDGLPPAPRTAHPTERLVVLLADVFDQPFEEISRILGTSRRPPVASWRRGPGAS